MRVAVFGLGYVGCVSAACLAASGHTVYGVDIDPIKRESILRGRAPVVEKGLDDLVAAGIQSGRLRVTDSASEAVLASDVSLICVGTPSNENGSLDLRYATRVAREIGVALRPSDTYHCVAFRSTMLPGSVESVLIPVLEEHARKRAGRDFGVAYNPEFLREGSSVTDYYAPSRTVIGALDGRAADLVCRLYENLAAPVVQTSIRPAEMVKYVDNAFHALKIAFANEVGAICKAEEIDSHQVMNIFCLDTKLNLSPAYLKPGAPYGGSCLPKDLRALTHHARANDLTIPVLEAIGTSNDQHKAKVLNLVMRQKGKRVGILGLSFKAGTDDLRESPTVGLVEALLGKGYQVRIYDRDVSLGAIFGSNRVYIEREVPHIGSLVTDSLDHLVEMSDVIVVANSDSEYRTIVERLHDNQILIDLVRIAEPDAVTKGKYVGVAW